MTTRSQDIRITRGLWIGRTEVTVAAFTGFTAATGYRTATEREGWALAWYDGAKWEQRKRVTWKTPGYAQGPDHPVVAISWDDARTFCAWSGGRLPTEANWEYAARGGPSNEILALKGSLSHETANYGEDECCGPARVGRDEWDFTSPAGSFLANGFALYDMVGNVREWTADWYGPYEPSLAIDPHRCGLGTAARSARRVLEQRPQGSACVGPRHG